MRIKYSTKTKNGDAIKMLDDLSKVKLEGDLERLGSQAISKFASGTPVDTGKTASKWGYDVETKSSGIELTFTNSNVTNTGIPIPVLAYYGHGTGTGGYVPPKDYITQPMDDVAEEAGKLIERRLKNGR